MSAHERALRGRLGFPNIIVTIPFPFADDVFHGWNEAKPHNAQKGYDFDADDDNNIDDGNRLPYLNKSVAIGVDDDDEGTPAPSERPRAFHIGYDAENSQSPISFGRTGCNVPLSDKANLGLSRRHFDVQLSKYGTWMVHCHSKNGLILDDTVLRKGDQRALDPTRENVVHHCRTLRDDRYDITASAKVVLCIIKVVAAHERKLFGSFPDEDSGVPETDKTVDLADGLSCLPIDQPSQESRVHPASVTETQKSYMPQVSRPPLRVQRNYHLLLDKPIDKNGRSCHAIQANQTGMPCIASRFSSHAIHLFAFFKRFRQVSVQNPHLVSLIDIQRNDESILLITSLGGEFALRDVMISVKEACLAVVQLPKALEACYTYLPYEPPSDDNIFFVPTPSVRKRFLAGGYAERLAMHPVFTRNEASHESMAVKDMRKLGGVISKALERSRAEEMKFHDTDDGMEPLDPLLMLHLERMKSVCEDDIQTLLENAHRTASHGALNEISLSSVTVEVDLEWSHEKDVSWMRLDGVQQAWSVIKSALPAQPISSSDQEAFNRFIRSSSKAVRKVGEIKEIKESRVRTLFCRFNLDDAVDEMLTRTEGTTKKRFHTVCGVSHHKGSHHYNLRHLLSLCQHQQLESDIQRSGQEVWGPSSKHGLYIHLSQLGPFLDRNRMALGRIPLEAVAPVPSFTEIDRQLYILLWTGLPWMTFLTLRRKDSYTRWPIRPSEWLSPDEATTLCEKYLLRRVKRQILKHAGLNEVDRQAPERWHPEDDEKQESRDGYASDTSRDTNSSSDRLVFKRRRYKS